MSIAQLFEKKAAVFSCEVFPPKKTSPIETIYATLDGLEAVRPDFISVTFGAGGLGGRSLTGDIVAMIERQYQIPAVAHLACVNLTRAEVAETLKDLRRRGVTHLLALRGDLSPDLPPKTDFRYASELIAFIRAQPGDFHVSAACYPEGHIESPSLVEDVRHLKEKVDAGAEHLISQLFFNNDDFYAFLERTAIAGINVPIEAGIMPVTSAAQIQRMVSLCGASLPRKLTRLLGKYGDHPEALRDAGVAYAVDQISDLLASGVRGVHLYTMNNAAVARRISESVASLLRV